MTRRVLRCALYTRKSSEEGLDQAFNSLDAQREACEAYVKSQAGEGWKTVRQRYDDGGHSGGSMDRPSLQRLLGDIERGGIDVVVVYKIDRLTRSLADFARMVELFDRRGVSFVSVTQAFNTTTSMGRLTLNVLLSFAQFEREVTGERIRDKIAASKAKGMWMGGNLPLGYDKPRDSNRTLVVNEAEAGTVRTIFARYLELRSVHALERWLRQEGIRSKRRTTLKGRTSGGQRFSRGALFHLLRNRVYLGMIVHKGIAHPGQHAAIIDPDTFDKAQALLDANRRRHARQVSHAVRTRARAPLSGRIFDAAGNAMSPTSAHGKAGRTYRYYVSTPLQQGRSSGPVIANAPRRIAAAALEARLAQVMHRLSIASGHDPLQSIERIDILPEQIVLTLPEGLLTNARHQWEPGEEMVRDPMDPDRIQLRLRASHARRGGSSWIMGDRARAKAPDPTLVRALREAHLMIQKDRDGMPVIETAPTSPWRRNLIRLAFLSPQIQQAILTGNHPLELTLSCLMDPAMPLAWNKQARFLGIKV